MLNYDDAGVKKWAMSLANPWSGPARMPSPCPIQTCVYSDKIVNTITVGSAQSFVFCFNPQVLNSGEAKFMLMPDPTQLLMKLFTRLWLGLIITAVLLPITQLNKQPVVMFLIRIRNKSRLHPLVCGLDIWVPN